MGSGEIAIFSGSQKMLFFGAYAQFGCMECVEGLFLCTDVKTELKNSLIQPRTKKDKFSFVLKKEKKVLGRALHYH